MRHWAAPVWWWPIPAVWSGTALVLCWFAWVICLRWIAAPETQPLLALHVMAILIGYLLAFSAGTMSLFYVVWSALRPLKLGQRKLLVRTMTCTNCAIPFFIGLGIILGGIWARQHLGGFWTNDPREIGTALFLLWSVALALAWRWKPMWQHAWLLLAVAGNIVAVAVVREVDAAGQSPRHTQGDRRKSPGQRPGEARPCSVGCPVRAQQRWRKLLRPSPTSPRATRAASAHITTRQNIQFHFVKLNDVEPAMRELADEGLTTREACGNSVRNITGCPYAGVVGRRDLRRHAVRRGADALLPAPSAQRRAAAQVQDRLRRVPRGSRARLDQRHRLARARSWTAARGLPRDRRRRHVDPAGVRLRALRLPAGRERCSTSAEAVVRVFHKFGDYKHKQRNRMKFLDQGAGLGRLRRASIEEALAEFRREGGAPLPFDPEAPPGRRRRPTGRRQAPPPTSQAVAACAAHAESRPRHSCRTPSGCSRCRTPYLRVAAHAT